VLRIGMGGGGGTFAPARGAAGGAHLVLPIVRSSKL
jgi:hypothetical protein